MARCIRPEDSAETSNWTRDSNETIVGLEDSTEAPACRGNSDETAIWLGDLTETLV